MREFVGEYAPHLVPRHQLQQALVDADRRVARVATGGEGVGLIGRRDVEPRHGQVGPLRQIFDDAVVVGCFFTSDGDTPRRRDGELVAEPIRTADQNDAEREADEQPALAEQAADGNGEAAHCGQ